VSGERRGREARLRDVARRIFGEGDPPEAEEGRPEPSPSRHEARDLLAAFLETGDKAKTEIVRMVAREVRSYLEALELHKDLHHLLTNYSLEVKASVHLRPLAEVEKATQAGASEVKVGFKPKEGKAPRDGAREGEGEANADSEGRPTEG
jgi:hypothetical protein